VARFEDVLVALSHYRVELQAAIMQDMERQGHFETDAPTTESQPMRAFSLGGASPVTATPLTNVHATGAGVRVRNGQVVPNDFVLKVYVFEKLNLGDATPELTRGFGSIEVDVEPLPLQLAGARTARRSPRPQRGPAAPRAAIANRNHLRPIPGGMSISPMNANYVGTLGCFVRGVTAGAEQIYALSNNHVLADVNTLPVGTPIVQPGPETGPTNPANIFAALTAFVPVQFPVSRSARVVNHFDAAIARVADQRLIQVHAILGIRNYIPNLAAPVPGTPVTKSGRTTGITAGVITAIHVNGVQVNYGTRANPRVAVFDDVIEIIGNAGQPFSLPGDSGSVIIESNTGRPVALLFAGDGRTTDACDLAGVCRQFQVLPN
jgi:hypothetical protein